MGIVVLPEAPNQLVFRPAEALIRNFKICQKFLINTINYGIKFVEHRYCINN